MNYARFYGLLRLLGVDSEKEGLVHQYTGGRTTSVKEVTEQEYRAMCEGLNRQLNREIAQPSLVALRRSRSAVLHQMQLMGVNTADWDAVNAVCRNPRVSGKAFAELTLDELGVTLKRLRAIRHKEKQHDV